jgi:hypothetical protein
MSVTGPHTRLSHSAGVEKSRATGFLPITSRRLVRCRSSGGSRVSIALMSPPADASVSVATLGARSPGAGIGLSALTSVVVPAPAGGPRRV